MIAQHKNKWRKAGLVNGDMLDVISALSLSSGRSRPQDASSASLARALAVHFFSGN